MIKDILDFYQKEDREEEWKMDKWEGRTDKAGRMDKWEGRKDG